MFETIFTAATAGSIALSGGGTGLLSIPSAELMPENSIEYQYSNGVLSVDPDSDYADLAGLVDNAMTDHLQFSVVPQVEFGLRLTTWYGRDNSRGEDGRIMNDLSGHIKAQLFKREHFRFAVGVRDFEGAAQYLAPAKFAVADFYGKRWQVVAGFGQADHGGVALDGFFGGLKLSPFHWLDVLADYDAVAWQAGLNLHVQHKGTAAYLKGYYSSQDYQDYAFAAGLRFSIDQRRESRPWFKESVWPFVRRDRDEPHQDAIVDWRASDGYARGLRGDGRVSSCVGSSSYSAYSVPVLRTGCRDGRTFVRWSTNSEKIQPFHLQLRLEPAIEYTMGSEVGRFDYSTTLRSSAQLLVYGGLTVHGAWDTVLAKSDDYQDNGVYGFLGHRDGLMEAAAQYTMHALDGLFLQVTAGRSRARIQEIGFQRGEVAWLLFGGRAGLNYSYTGFDRKQSATGDYQSLGKAFFWLKPAEYAAQVTAGDFLYRDRGYRVDMYRYLGRARVGVFAKYGEETGYKSAGMTVSMPLGGVASNRWVSVAGTPHSEIDLDTQVRVNHSENVYRPGFLQEFEPQRSLILDVLDNWRASPVYIENAH